MFTPPPGYDDLLGDADLTPIRGDLADLDVPTVGTVQARRPQPRSVAALAASVRPRTNGATRLEHMHVFVTEHTAPGTIPDLLARMVEGELPDDTIGAVARAVATWGTARPYPAVITLAGITGQHWRPIRTHLINNGVPEPMRLPSMHALLDITETLVVESMQEKTASATKLKRDQFFNSLYRPPPAPAEAVPADRRAVPQGFSDEEMEDSFDAFAKVAKSGR